MSPGALKLALAGVLALLLITAGGVWRVQDWRYGKQLAEQAGLHKDDLTAISNAAADQVRQALDKQQVAEQARADIDLKTTKEKKNDLAENERLRGVVAAGERRLRIAGSCSASGSNVPSTTVGPDLDDGRTFELSSVAGQTVFDIRAGIIADQTALKGLQRFVMNVCR
jgi:prophage endopeptidase